MTPPSIPPPRGFNHWASIGGHEFAQQGPLVLCLATRPPTFDVMDRLADLHLTAGPPRMRPFVCVVNADAPPPSDKERQAVSHYYSKAADRLSASALVIEGNGFRAAAKRGAVSFVSLTARFPFPYYVCGTVPEALAKLNRLELGGGVDENSLVAAFAHLRSRTE